MPVHKLFGGYGDYEEALLLMHLNANVVPVCTHCSGELRIEYYGQIVSRDNAGIRSFQTTVKGKETISK